MTPETDVFPPVLHSDEWEEPVPMDGPINTAGAEDAPVITPDGNTFFFFFTPDVNVPPDKQLLDGVTGIWWCKKNGDSWTEPERIILSHSLALDAPICIEGDILWFASMRQGNYGDDGDMWTAEYKNGRWSNWKNAGQQLNEEYNVGELYTSSDGSIMYCMKLGGYGSYDLWKSEKTLDGWSEPINLGPTVNTELGEGMPFLSSDGTELWFNRPSELGYPGPALFRTVKTEDGNWSTPEEIISNYAGDPAMDDAGNLYFVHHYYSEDGKMIEADIYVAYKK